MGLPNLPVTLTVAQLDELNRKLATMRHDINNYLSLILAASELIRHKPQMAERMMTTLGEQPAKSTRLYPGSPQSSSKPSALPVLDRVPGTPAQRLPVRRALALPALALQC